MNRVKEMSQLLDGFEVEVFNKWKEEIPGKINSNMKKFLLCRTEDGLLQLNFDEVLVAALKETKLLKAIQKESIPDVALELYEISDALWVICNVLL